MNIGALLRQATRRLTTAGIATARLDALLLISDALGKEKSWVLAHLDEMLTPEAIATIQSCISRRAHREPLAYIRGHQEFYGRTFIVTPDVLIPRPETEACIDLAKKYAQKGRLLDVGTGSGALAVTLALELPETEVEACDISLDALAIARQNARDLGAKVRFFQSDLLQRATTYHIIIANLPYVAHNWERSPETSAEPAMALFADDSGLTLINQLITTAPLHLSRHGYLVLEADPRQHTAIIAQAQAHNFQHTQTEMFALALQFMGGTRVVPKALQ